MRDDGCAADFSHCRCSRVRLSVGGLAWCACARVMRVIADVIIALPAGPVCRPPAFTVAKHLASDLGSSRVQSRMRRCRPRRPAAPHPEPAAGSRLPRRVRVGVGRQQFTPLLVMYRQDGSLSDVAVDGLLFTYVLGIVPALLIGGPLSDRLGRRPLMFPGTGLRRPRFGAARARLPIADPMSLGRVFSGVALGPSMAVGGSWIAEISRREGAANRAATRATMSLTAGFGGCRLAAVLAQWAPGRTCWPTRSTSRCR